MLDNQQATETSQQQLGDSFAKPMNLFASDEPMTMAAGVHAGSLFNAAAPKASGLFGFMTSGL